MEPQVCVVCVAVAGGVWGWGRVRCGVGKCSPGVV